MYRHRRLIFRADVVIKSASPSSIADDGWKQWARGRDSERAAMMMAVIASAISLCRSAAAGPRQWTGWTVSEQARTTADATCYCLRLDSATTDL